MDNQPGKQGLFAKICHCTGFQDKKLWDILQLLMPLIIAIVGTIIFQWAMKERDLKIADDRANQEALIAYFDQTASLLFEHNLRTSQVGDEAGIVARARTLAALRELDGERKSQLVKFLVEAELITGKTSVIKLSNADLSDVDLRGRNLQGAVIPWAILDRADLRGADFRGADLNHTSLCKSNLRGVNFDHTNLNHAILDSADLQGVSLENASLHEASFFQTNLTHAKMNSNALETAVLCKTIMPDSTRNDRDCFRLKSTSPKNC